MAFMKHIGKHGDRKVAIVYRTVPGEEHMALVIYTETLARAFHDSIMKIIEGKVGQEEESLADALHRSLLPDGRPMLQTLHQEGKLKKVQTKQIIVTPNATSHVHLDELNKIMDGMEAGGEAAEKMAELDKNSGMDTPVERQHLEEVAPEASSEGALDDVTLGNDMLKQSNQMAAEGASLVAESKRLKKEALKLNPALKPKRVVKKKAAKKSG